MKRTKGIHHVTAIVGHPQENVDFYHGVLGLRLIKKTVNFDDPGTYHLYFGDETGTPGTIITFFPWPKAYKGAIGDGQVGVTAYQIPKGASSFWKERLASKGVDFVQGERFGETVLHFEDPHGLRLELTERDGGKPNRYQTDGITPEKAIQGFAGAVLYSANPEQTAELLESGMGLTRTNEEDGFIRFAGSADIGSTIDVKTESAGTGRMGVGTVHHIAWRAEDDRDQLEWKAEMETQGYQVTPVQDRNYFNAIYFREHGGLLFEIATDPPGFAIDEAPEVLGEHLMLPPQYEEHRERIEEILIPIKLDREENE